MNRRRIFYVLLVLVAIIAAGYFAFTYLAPPEALAPVAAGIKAGDTSLISGGAFTAKQTFVNLPVTAGKVGWPTPFQTIYDRGIPGIYVAPNKNDNNANNPLP